MSWEQLFSFKRLKRFVIFCLCCCLHNVVVSFQATVLIIRAVNWVVVNLFLWKRIISAKAKTKLRKAVWKPNPLCVHCLKITKNVSKVQMTIFGIFNELLSTQNVNIARFARNVEWDFFCNFQTPCITTFFFSFLVFEKRRPKTMCM